MCLIKSMPVFVLLLLLSACGRDQRGRTDVPLEAESAREVTLVQQMRAVDAAAPPPAPAPAAPTRMVIRTAHLRLTVADPFEATARFNDLARAHGGFAAGSRQWREGGQVFASVTLRVPSDRLDAVLESMRKAAVRVESENVSGQDVTGEYTDLAARQKNMEAAEAELRHLLTTIRERTARASEVLEVYNELTRIRGEIEQIKGRMHYLSQMTALSTIEAELLPDVVAQPLMATAWRPLATATQAGAALIGTLKHVADGAIWLVVYVVPVALLVLVPIAGSVRMLRRRAMASRSA